MSNTYTNILSEEYLLGALLLDPESVIMTLRGDGIDQASFTTKDNQRIWTMANRLYNDGRIHSIEVMDIEPDVLGSHEGKELAATIWRLRDKCLGLSHIKQHVETVKAYKATRMTREASSAAIASIEQGAEAESVIAGLQDKLNDALLQLKSSKPWKTTEEITEEMVNIIETANRPELQTGVSSGIQSIDHHTGGLDKEQLWVVAAPSSCGKTMLMMQVAQSFLNQGKSVLAYSFETSAGKLGIRSLANGMSIRGNALLARQGEKLTKSDIGRIKTGISELNQANNLTICDNYDLTLDSMMASAAQRKKLGFDIDLIVVDYIQLVSVMGQGKSREQEVAEISRGLKKMAKQHGCPVITASQLNEEGRTRESRAIVNDADVLLTIDPEDEKVVISKNREGERGVGLSLRMNGQYQRFEEYN